MPSLSGEMQRRLPVPIPVKAVRPSLAAEINSERCEDSGGRSDAVCYRPHFNKQAYRKIHPAMVYKIDTSE